MCLHVYGAKTKNPVITMGPNSKLHRVKDPSFKMYGNLVARPGVEKPLPKWCFSSISRFLRRHFSSH